jgi:hypothetical protein
METKEIDITKLNKAVEKFGSLQKANTKLESEKLALQKRNTQLKQKNKKLEATRDNLIRQIEDMNAKKKDYQSQLQSLSRQIKIHGYQYELFCGFMAMLTESPSVTDSIDNLINAFLILKEPGWYLSKDVDEMRSIFIRAVMGDYLKSNRCSACGAKFLVNKKPKYKILGNSYYCPSCYSSSVEADDSFLKTMVSEKQIENTRYIEKVLKELEVLEPFKAFLDVPCEICGEPIMEWDEYSVKLVMQGIGNGHTRCWNSDLGRLMELRRALQKIKQS